MNWQDIAVRFETFLTTLFHQQGVSGTAHHLSSQGFKPWSPSGQPKSLLSEPSPALRHQSVRSHTSGMKLPQISKVTPSLEAVALKSKLDYWLTTNPQSHLPGSFMEVLNSYGHQPFSKKKKKTRLTNNYQPWDSITHLQNFSWIQVHQLPEPSGRWPTCRLYLLLIIGHQTNNSKFHSLQ